MDSIAFLGSQEFLFTLSDLFPTPSNDTTFFPSFDEEEGESYEEESQSSSSEGDEVTFPLPEKPTNHQLDYLRAHTPDVFSELMIPLLPECPKRKITAHSTL